MHRICQVREVEVTGEYRIEVRFDDGVVREIDLGPVLAGEIYGPLRDKGLFDLVKVDAEIGTIVWPNGADFDPATLYEWPDRGKRFAEQAARWAAVQV